MNTRLNQLGAAVAVLSAVLAGCAPVAPRWESSFGNAVRASVASQVADPAAARNASPVTGLDGAAAEAAHRQYVRSFSVPTDHQPAMISGSGK